MTKICIIGGGASGMMSAIIIASKNPLIDITIIEKKEKLGSKLYATGNGRCNISNSNCDTFGETCKVFRKVGVEIKITEEGRAYPVSEQAKDVVFALETAIKAYGINIIVNHTVTDVKPMKNGKYKVLLGKKEMDFDGVILATGGKCAAHFGTTGDGYKLATNLGHKVNKLIPALVPIECSNKLIGSISGVRVKAKVTLKREGQIVDEQVGEIQFTKDGLSGIAIFNMSSHVRIGNGLKFSSYNVVLDLIAQYKNAEILYILSLRRNIKGLKTADLFNAIVNRQIASRLLKEVSENKPDASNLTEEDMKKIVNLFRNVNFEVTGVKGWKEAQCTAGGVDFDQFDKDTMESKIYKGLYFVGEVIDYDGPCGGYNLENAWVTARKAGKAICTEYTK